MAAQNGPLHPDLTGVRRARHAWSVRVEARLDWLRTRLWFIPGTFAAAAAVASLVIVGIDHLVDAHLPAELSGLLFSGGPDSARPILATVSAAMLTFTGLVFSVTMLVLQQASSQLSPRVMRTFLRDRVNQTVLGLFVATFLYSLLVLREIRSPASGSAFVPAIAVSLTYVLLLASIIAFVYYIHHMAQAIRAASVLRSVGNETRTAIERLYPDGIAEEPDAVPPTAPAGQPDRVVLMNRQPGVITSVNDAVLLNRAREHHLVIALLHMVGDFVPTGSPVFHVWYAQLEDRASEEGVDELADAVQIGLERTMTQDAAFGFRQVVDIAVRALSPGVNDPTTAVQALDEIHDLLRRLAVRQNPSPVRLSEDGAILLYLPRPSWADYVALALDEIRQYGSGSQQVARRLRYLLLDLRGLAPEFRHEAIDRQLRLLDAGLPAAFPLDEDRRVAASPSVSGQGPADSGVPSDGAT